MIKLPNTVMHGYERGETDDVHAAQVKLRQAKAPQAARSCHVVRMASSTLRKHSANEVDFSDRIHSRLTRCQSHHCKVTPPSLSPRVCTTLHSSYHV